MFAPRQRFEQGIELRAVANQAMNCLGVLAHVVPAQERSSTRGRDFPCCFCN